MYFVHDPENNIFYYGYVEPYPHMMRDLLVDNTPYKIAFDFETISLKERLPVGFAICPKRDMAFYFPLFPEESGGIPWHITINPDILKVAHNAPFDMAAARLYDGWDFSKLSDTNVRSRLLGYRNCSLENMSIKVDRPTRNMGDVLAEHHVNTTLDLPIEVVAKKCCNDVIATFALEEWLDNNIIPQDYYDVEMQVVRISEKMSARGIKIDHDWLDRLYAETSADEQNYLQLCQNMYNFNPGSNQQIGYILAKRGAYKIFRTLPMTESGKDLKADEETLSQMDDPLAQVILDYKEVQKLNGTYLRPYLKAERAYTQFHTDAVTGRPSSTGGTIDVRNMQNIPGLDKKTGRNPRGCLVPDNPPWTDVDFKQMELRILAFFSGDRQMNYLFSLPTDDPRSDIHQHTADLMGIDRKIAKNVNFAMPYGGSEETLMETAGIKDIRLVKQLLAGWKQQYPQAWDYIECQMETGYRQGYIHTHFGRRIMLPTEEYESVNGIKRKAINYPIQGTAAEVLKRGLIILDRMGYDLALQIHDEALVDGDVTSSFPKEEMEHIAPFWTPMDIETMERWK
jgi:DNA polymerase I-like protein with 3'-5' exonuclease and polymerase domains